MAKKVYEEQNIQAIADKIREKTGGNATYKPSDMPSGIEEVYKAGQESGGGSGGYDEGYEAGQKAEKEREWKTRQSNGYRVNYLYAFAGTTWTDSVYEPIYPITASENASSMFNYSFITDTKVPIDLSEAIRNLANIFDNSKLVTIRKLIINETTPGLTVTNATRLKDLVVEGVIGANWKLTGCNELSHDSLMSIINALKDFRIVTKTYKTVWYQWYDGCGSEDCKNKVYTVDHGYHLYENLFVYEFASKELNEDGIPTIIQVEFQTAIEHVGAKTFMFDDNNTLTLTIQQEEPTETRTLTIGSTNLAKLTDAEKAIATDKGWTLA